MQEAVKQLIETGPLPAKDAPEAESEAYDKYENVIHRITPPLTTEEANALIPLLEPDHESF